MNSYYKISGFKNHVKFCTFGALFFLAAIFKSNISIAQCSTGIYESYAIVSINGGANAFYDMQSTTALPDFEGANLGTFSPLQSLVLKGGQNKTFKCNGGDVTASRIFYRVWRTADGASGSFIQVNHGFLSNDAGGCGGNQTWEGTGNSINLISGLTIGGNYTLEVYSSILTNCGGEKFSSNLGNNYKATFTITPTISSTGSLTGLSTVYGTASSNTSFSVSGAKMSAAITVTAPTGFQVSTNASTGFANSISIGAAGTIASTTIFVRLAANTAFGNYSGNIVLSSTGATNVNVATVSSSVATAPLTITGITANNKNYNGNTTATLAGTATYVGLQNSESFSANGTPTATFNTAAAGNTKPVTVTGYTAPNANYSISQPTGLTANIIPAPLTITGVTANNKNYDGNTTATLAGTASYVGLQNSESFTVTGTPTATFNTAAAGNSKPVTVTGYTAPNANYSISQPTGLTANIIAAPLTITGITANNKNYDGNTSATLAGTASYVGLQNSESFTVTGTPTATFNTAAAGNSKPVTVTGYTAPNANYSISQPTGLTANIIAAPLTITGITANNKNYDGNTSATLAGTASYVGLQNSESFTVTGTPTATFNTANAGTAKPVTVVGYTAPNANYSITQPTGLTADIIAAPLTITGITANNKNYNGNTTATLAGTASYVGLQNSESFTVTGTPTATFNTANAGTAKPVTVVGYTAPNANYSITQPTGLTADIIAAPLTITGITANNKNYDGNTSATLVGTATYVGLQNSESFTVTGTPTATFNTANAGTAKPVTVVGYTAPNANYSITQPIGLTADIIGLPIGTANFRSKNSGNFSSIATWQYDQGGNDFVDATQVPTGNNNINIQNGHAITLDVNFTIPTGKTINLDATSSLVINPTSRLTIAGTADFNNQSVTLQSTNAGTASIGQITGSLIGATNVTVERYIPANTLRAWRLLAVPTKGSQTIKQSWQEGQAQLANGNAGYGTIITSNISSPATLLGAGFDAFTVSPSMQRYGTGAWVNVTNTNVAIESDKAYFLYIRGSRAITPSTATSAVDATTLRTTGTLYQGAVTVNTAGSFTPIANVYASSVDFTQLTRSGVSNTYYLWDAKKASGAVLGAYQTFSGTNSFQCIPGGGSFTQNQVNTTIQSGQGFFVSGVGSVTFNESAKVSGSSLAGYRPATPVNALVKIDSRLYNNNNTLLDANVVVFNNNYANAVDADDAVKYTNPAENFGIVTNNINLAVEGRKPITADDVINFSVSNLKEQTYTVEFTAANMSNSNLEAQLVDKYLGTSTPVDITGVTKVNITVNADAASKAADRFSLVFKVKITVPSITKAGISVSPNPVEGSSMNLQFANQAAGKYTVRILNLQGKAITTAVINHAGGSSNQVISLSNKVAAGMYKVEVIGADKTRTVQTVFVQ